MNMLRITTIVQKNILLMSRDPLQITDLVYWPLLDITLWGFSSAWLASQDPAHSSAAIITLIALTLFHIMSRAHMDVAVNLITEIWDRNLVNIFSSPLSVSEWAMGVMIIGSIKGAFTLLFCSAVIWLLHGFNVFFLGWMLMPFVISLVFCGWAIGFFTAGMLLYWGQKAQSFIWSLGWLCAAFCGVFYPITVLPVSAQYISRLLPMTYVFEGVRFAITTNTLPVSNIVLGFIMSIVYFIAARIFFAIMFTYSLERGLSRLEYE